MKLKQHPIIYLHLPEQFISTPLYEKKSICIHRSPFPHFAMGTEKARLALERILEENCTGTCSVKSKEYSGDGRYGVQFW